MEKEKTRTKTVVDLSQPVNLVYLLDVIEQVLAAGRTPLLLDTPDRLVRTFYEYGNGIILDCREMTIRLLKGESELRLREAARRTIVDAIKCGYTLVISCGNAAPAFISKLCHSQYFPIELFDSTINRKNDTWGPLFRAEDRDRWGNAVRWLHTEHRQARTS